LIAFKLRASFMRSCPTIAVKGYTDCLAIEMISTQFTAEYVCRV
jgi:hypothetical protein